MKPIGKLLAGLIDYAGLFPPAALEMDEAARNYAAYRFGPQVWALGRFVIPLARLAELPARDWKLSVLATPAADLPPEVDVVEVKMDRAEDIRAWARAKPGLVRYVEIPIATDPTDLVAALAATGARAKVRTGGVTPEAVPAAADLARFLCACAQANVRFKATAGLHHPVRSAQMHGFVNLFLAAALAYEGAAPPEIAATLEERAPSAFHWDDGGVNWHGHRLTTRQIARSRDTFAISFGSCSFEEPLADLRALGWL